jgi:hypothetical protein
MPRHVPTSTPVTSPPPPRRFTSRQHLHTGTRFLDVGRWLPSRVAAKSCCCQVMCLHVHRGPSPRRSRLPTSHHGPSPRSRSARVTPGISELPLSKAGWRFIGGWPRNAMLPSSPRGYFVEYLGAISPSERPRPTARASWELSGYRPGEDHTRPSTGAAAPPPQSGVRWGRWSEASRRSY